MTTVEALPTVTIRIIGLAGSEPLMTFLAVTGQSYTLEYKHFLSDPAWTPIGATVFGSNGVMTLQDTNAPADSRFYRLRLQ